MSNPLPASFDVVPKRGEDTEAIAVKVQGSKLAAVEEVRYGKEVSERILQIARAIQIVFLIAVVVLSRPRRFSSRTRSGCRCTRGGARSR